MIHIYRTSVARCVSESSAFLFLSFPIRSHVSTFTSTGLLAKKKKKSIFLDLNPPLIVEEYFYLEENSRLVGIFCSFFQYTLLSCLAFVFSNENH